MNVNGAWLPFALISGLQPHKFWMHCTNYVWIKCVVRKITNTNEGEIDRLQSDSQRMPLGKSGVMLFRGVVMNCDRIIVTCWLLVADCTQKLHTVLWNHWNPPLRGLILRTYHILVIEVSPDPQASGLAPVLLKSCFKSLSMTLRTCQLVVNWQDTGST
jgi:hypothetical protein